MRRIAVLDAPSNLGLRPPTATSVPGCAKAPGALRDHGLLTRLGARDAGCLTPPRYDTGDWRPGDGVAHAPQIAAYTRKLADRIGAILDAGEFPVILGGDCSILLGSGLAMHRLGEAVDGHIGLVFVDGHSDFRHPGNASYVGAAAGEDLALVTGRGQADLASIEGRRPYFRDIDVVVLGIRAQDEYRLDLQAAGIVTRPVPALRAEGAARSAQWARDQLADCAGYWVHVDVDVLDPAVMPAVDAPSPGGIAFPELELLLAGLVESPHCLGVEITVFDPDYDTTGEYAAEITSTVSAGLAPAKTVALRPDLAAARRDLDRSPSLKDPETARQHRRAEASHDSVSLAATAASGDSGTPEAPLPATTLLAVEDAADLPFPSFPAEEEDADSLSAAGSSGLGADSPSGAGSPGAEEEADSLSAADSSGAERDADRFSAATSSGAGESADSASEGGEQGAEEVSGEVSALGSLTAVGGADSFPASGSFGAEDGAESASAGGSREAEGIAGEAIAVGSLGAEDGVDSFPALGSLDAEDGVDSLPAPGSLGAEGGDDSSIDGSSQEAEGIAGQFSEVSALGAEDGDSVSALGLVGAEHGAGSIAALKSAGVESDVDLLGDGESADDAAFEGAEHLAEATTRQADVETAFTASEPETHEAGAEPSDDELTAGGEAGAQSRGEGSEPGSEEVTAIEVADKPGDGSDSEAADLVANRDGDEPGVTADASDRVETTFEEPPGRFSRLGPRSGSVDSVEPGPRMFPRPLGSAPLLDSEPLPATRPGMLRPRRAEAAEDDASAAAPHTSDGFSLPVQRPRRAFDAGSDEPADIA